MKAFIVEKELCGVTSRLIWNALRDSPLFPDPLYGYPTHRQVSAYVKDYRKNHGTKNTIASAATFWRTYALHADITNNTPFVFGYKSDEDGFPHVGNGSDEDPLIFGVSSNALLIKCLEFRDFDNFGLFRADATFKLSNLSYPVITCGFSDKARGYHVAAILPPFRNTSPVFFWCCSKTLVPICYWIK
jgi:hypothetical protein